MQEIQSFFFLVSYQENSMFDFLQVLLKWNN